MSDQQHLRRTENAMTESNDVPDQPLHAPLPGHPDGELLQLVQRATTHASNASALYGEGSPHASDAALVSIASSLAYIAEQMARMRLDDAQEEADRLAFCWYCREGGRTCQNCGSER